METQLKAAEPMLFVDLDGTLIRSDLLYESTVALLRRNPLYLLLLPFWLLRGRAYLKRRIAERVELRVELLPYRFELLDRLISEQKAGRKLALATASDRNLAEAVARHLGLFEGVLASDPEHNLRGAAKLEAIRRRCPDEAFDYVGDSRADLPIWREAREAWVLSSDRRLIKEVEQQGNLKEVFPARREGIGKTLLRALRVHQWLKNLLLAVPAIMGQRWDAVFSWDLLLAFLAFSSCASAVYLLNDLMDLEADRQNSFRKGRPCAGGDLSLLYASVLALLCLLLAVGLSLWLAPPFRWALGIYVLTTSLYSFWLKRVAVVDILVLALLYTLRILAGGVAVAVVVSPWLLAFSLFMFLSLASVKRLAELQSLKRERQDKTAGRGYYADDLSQISQFGSAAGYIAVLVLALYINSKEVTHFYAREELLWLLCPILLFWISRVLLLSHRGEIHEDPVIFAVKDRVSYLVALLALAVLLLAI